MQRAAVTPLKTSHANYGDQAFGLNKIIGSAAREIVSGEGWFLGKSDARLRERWWLPQYPKALVAIIHGYAEHSNRYAHVAETFAEQGYAVYTYDQRSHGESDGQETYVDSFDDFVEDMEHFLAHVSAKIGNLPTFILGHSMGGLVAVHYLATRRQTSAGILLTGPALTVSDEIPNWLVNFSQTIGYWFPTLPTIRVRYRSISHDSDIMTAHVADPLIYRGRVPARTAAELSKAIVDVKSCLGKIVTPIYIAHGSADKVVPVAASQLLYNHVGSTDKTLHVYDDLYHEILNETNREEVKANMVAWMEKRL